MIGEKLDEKSRVLPVGICWRQRRLFIPAWGNAPGIGKEFISAVRAIHARIFLNRAFCASSSGSYESWGVRPRLAGEDRAVGAKHILGPPDLQIKPRKIR